MKVHGTAKTNQRGCAPWKAGVAEAGGGRSMTRIVIAGLDNIYEALGCSKKTLYKWIKEKNFPAFKMDGVWRTLPKEIEDWFEEQRSMARRKGGTSDPSSLER